MASKNINKGKILSMLAIAVIISGIVILSGCIENPPPSTPKKINITDMAGRVVEVPTNVDSIVCFGPGTLRLITYLNATDKVAGIEGGYVSENPKGAPYLLAHPELLNLPIVGMGGINFVPNHEAIANVKPDVIFVINIEPRMADDLQKKTGIPVVVLSYGPRLTTYYPEYVFKSLKIAGKILNKEDRANEVIQFIKNVNKDLNDRTKDIPDEEKKRVYVGGIGVKHGTFTRTMGEFPPFEAVNAKNVAEKLKNKSILSKAAIVVDKEKIIEWNPDVVFIDIVRYPVIANEYQKDPEFFNSLKAVQNKEVYGILPFNYYGTNIGTALADAYYIGKVLYPERFKDVDPEAKADEIYTFLVGKPVYEEMKRKLGGGFGKIELKSNETKISQPVAVLYYR